MGGIDAPKLLQQNSRKTSTNHRSAVSPFRDLLGVMTLSPYEDGNGERVHFMISSFLIMH